VRIKTWLKNQYQDLKKQPKPVPSGQPGYIVKIDVDNTNGCVKGLLIAPENESNPNRNHIHIVYNVKAREVIKHYKEGNTVDKSHSEIQKVIDDVTRLAPTLVYAINPQFKLARAYADQQVRPEKKIRNTDEVNREKLHRKLIHQIPNPDKCKGERDFERKFDEWAIKYQKAGFSDPWCRKPNTNYYNGY
jgi:hypothetical protein